MGDELGRRLFRKTRSCLLRGVSPWKVELVGQSVAAQTCWKMGRERRRRTLVEEAKGTDGKMLDSNTFDLNVSKGLAPDGLFQRLKKNE